MPARRFSCRHVHVDARRARASLGVLTLQKACKLRTSPLMAPLMALQLLLANRTSVRFLRLCLSLRVRWLLNMENRGPHTVPYSCLHCCCWRHTPGVSLSSDTDIALDYTFTVPHTMAQVEIEVHIHEARARAQTRTAVRSCSLQSC